jgi:hypothetical protein
MGSFVISPPTRDPEDQATAYAACIRAAVVQGASVIHRMVPQAAKSLTERAAADLDDGERRCRIEASQLLSRHQDALHGFYLDALRSEFAAPEEPDALKPAALSFDSLELMAEDQVDETVELVRAQQVVLSAVEGELAQLNAFISAARGEKVVRASANPLRPLAWVRALRWATLQCPVAAAVRLLWMQHLSEALASQLSGVYVQLCQLLREQGVAAASFVVNPASAQPRSGEQSESGLASASPAPLLNLHGLRQLLNGEKGGVHESHDDQAKPVVDPEAETVNLALTVPWSFQALQEMKQVDQVMQRIRQRRSGDPEGGVTDARAGPPSGITAVQALAEEVVKLMIENIVADQRLLPGVKQSVRDLEPALLRLVQKDPRFFNDKQHPARRFLSEMTQRSLAWSGAEAPGFAAFFEPLRQAVDTLAIMPIENAEPFEFALSSLEQTWGEQAQRNRRDRAAAARVLIKAEKRSLIAGIIADDLRIRPDMAMAPGEVRRFILGPWSQVMAAAKLADTGSVADFDGYGAIINDLIWTTQPRLAAQNPGRLAQLVPPMRRTLLRGLQSIDYPADATQRLMDYLADQHQSGLRPSSDGLAPSSADEYVHPEVWLERKEARATGFMECVADADLGGQVETTGSTGSEPLSPSAEGPGGLAAAGMQSGMSFDVFMAGAWSRWQLSWVSPHALLFMLTDGSGRYRSMTRSMLDKMMALGALRTVSQQSVVDGALDAVAQKALRNSTQQRAS